MPILRSWGSLCVWKTLHYGGSVMKMKCIETEHEVEPDYEDPHRLS